MPSSGARSRSAKGAPSARSRRATHAPMNPWPPVTRTFSPPALPDTSRPDRLADPEEELDHELVELLVGELPRGELPPVESRRAQLLCLLGAVAGEEARELRVLLAD